MSKVDIFVNTWLTNLSMITVHDVFLTGVPCVLLLCISSTNQALTLRAKMPSITEYYV